MKVFAYNRAIALTWDKQGPAIAVCVERAGRGWRVAKLLAGDEQQPLPEQLRALTEGLGRTSETLVILGGDPADACVTDVVVPDLQPADLQSALQLEIGRVSPIAADQLYWGYRRIGSAGKPGTIRVRLVYWPKSVAESALAAVSSVPGGVDCMLPPAAALDPLLAGQTVVTGAAQSDGLYPIARPTAGGTREWDLSDCRDEGSLFGGGASPLSLGGLDPGPAASLAADDQRALAPAIILALYALEGDVRADAETLAVLPRRMRPTRYLVLKSIAVIAALYLVGLVAVYAGGHLQDARRTRQAQSREAAELTEQKRALERRARDPLAMRDLLADLHTRAADRRLLAVALAVVNAEVDDRMWCQNFTWANGEMMITLVTPVDTRGVTDGLKASPYLSGYREEQRRLPTGGTEYRVTCTIRPLAEIDALGPPAMQWGQIAAAESVPPPSPAPTAQSPGAAPRQSSGIIHTGPGSVPPSQHVAPPDSTAPPSDSQPTSHSAPPGAVARPGDSVEHRVPPGLIAPPGVER